MFSKCSLDFLADLAQRTVPALCFHGTDLMEAVTDGLALLMAGHGDRGLHGAETSSDPSPGGPEQDSLVGQRGYGALLEGEGQRGLSSALLGAQQVAEPPQLLNHQRVCFYFFLGENVSPSKGLKNLKSI